MRAALFFSRTMSLKWKKNVLENLGERNWQYILIHNNKVTDTARHDKHMENLMGAEIFESGVQLWQLQRVDDAAYGIKDTSCKQPVKSGYGKLMIKRGKRKYADPSHGDIKDRRKPLRTGDPAEFDDHTKNGDAPYCRKHGITDPAPQRDDADGRIGTCHKHKNHHVVDFSQDLIDLLGDIQCMVYGAGAVQQKHAAHKNHTGDEIGQVAAVARPDKNRQSGAGCHDHADKMGDGAAWIFYFECMLFHNGSPFMICCLILQLIIEADRRSRSRKTAISSFKNYVF